MCGLAYNCCVDQRVARCVAQHHYQRVCVLTVALTTRIRRGLTQCLQLANVAHLASHAHAIVALRWLGPAPRLLSASSEKGSNGFVNTVLLTDVRSRQTVTMRKRGVEAAPLVGVRASPLGRHVLLLFKGAPTEIWAILPTARCVFGDQHW